MPQMMVKIYQMIKLSKGVPDTPNLNEAIIGPYKAYFIQTMA